MQYANAALNVYNDCPIGSVGWKNRDQYALNTAYSMGKQTIDKYKPLLIRGKDNTYNQMVTDWSVLPILYTKRQQALGIQKKESQNYEIRVNPIDPFAQDEVQAEIEYMRAKLLVRQALEAANVKITAPELETQPGEPEDLDGINIIELGYRHRTAMEVEQVQELIFNANDYDSINDYVMQDLFDQGFAVTKDETCNNSTVEIRRCDPANIILNYCAKPDFSDLVYMGELIAVPVNQLVAMSSGQMTREEIEQMYNMGNANTYMNYGFNVWTAWATFNDFWNKGKVQILDLEFLSTDREVGYEWTDKRNNKKFKVDNSDRKERKTDWKQEKSRYVQNVYRIKWIVGTTMAFDFGKQYNIPREKGNEYNARLSYHPVAINLRNMRAFSRTEALISCADAIQMAFYKLQHALNSVVPKGYAIDVSALEEVAIGSNGENLSPKQILDLYFNRGTYLFRSKSLVGNEKFQMPIIPMESGVGNEIVEYQNMITMNLNMIDKTLGLNDLTNGNTPNPKTLNGATQAAVQGTNNSLSDLFIAERKMTQKVAKNIVIRAQNIVTLGNADKMMYSLGSGTISILRSIKDIDNYIYSVSIEDLPTVDEISEFVQQMQIAQSQGEITISDVMMLQNIKNMKQKQMFLAYRVRKNKEQAEQVEQQKMEMNGQIQQQSAQVAEQAKQQTLQTEWQLRLQYLQMEKDLDLRNLNVQQQYMIEAKRIDATGRVEASFIQAKERDASNIRNNATAIMNSETTPDEKIGVIDVPAELKSTVEPQTANEQPLEIEPLPSIPFSFDDQPEMEEEQAYQQQPTI